MEARLIEPFKRYIEPVLTTLRNDRMFDERLGAADYWFIETTRLKPRRPLPRGIDLLSFDWGLLDRIEPEYKRFGEPFGSPRQILELSPWEDVDNNLYKDEPLPGPLPHPSVIRIDDDLL